MVGSVDFESGLIDFGLRMSVDVGQGNTLPRSLFSYLFPSITGTEAPQKFMLLKLNSLFEGGDIKRLYERKYSSFAY